MNPSPLRHLTQLAILCLAASGFAATEASPLPNESISRAGAALRQREYQLSPTHNGSSGALWQAPNRANNFRTTFTAEGIRMEPRDREELAATGVRPWTLHSTLRAVGRPGAMTPAASPGTPGSSPATNAIELPRGADTVETFLNNASGLKQNFILSTRPAGAGALRFEVSIATALKPTLSPNAGALVFTDASSGKVALRYGGLRVHDSTGKSLPARLSLEPAGGAWLLSIEVDDAGAAYPVTVDPLFENTEISQVGSDQAGGHFGLAVAGVGDMNGDGYGDVIIGAPDYDNGESGEGIAAVFIGAADGLFLGIEGYTLLERASGYYESNQAGASFGSSVAPAGDVNGDGLADVWIGAPGYDMPGLADAGAVFLFLGAPFGVQFTPGNPSTAAARLSGDAVGASFGYVSGRGDVNGDGRPDVVVGAPLYPQGGSPAGAVFVFQGPASGFANATSAQAATKIFSHTTDSLFGISVAIAGDVNGDGFADVIAGAPGYGTGGVAAIWPGSASGIAPLELADAPVILASAESGAQFGRSVNAAGDVNGDGIGDLIVGAPNADQSPIQVDTGVAFVYHGAKNAFTLATLPAATQLTFPTLLSGSLFGFSVAGVDDINGDGFGDVAVGAPGYSDIAAAQGLACFYLGGAYGAASTSVDTYARTTTNAKTGVAVAAGGDVNGDGYADPLVGASHVFTGYPGGDEQGSAALLRGRPYLRTAPLIQTDENGDAPIKGVTPASPTEFGAPVYPAGDINGDGYADFMIPDENRLGGGGFSNEGVLYIYLGGAVKTPTRENADSVLLGNQANAGFGQPATGIGDINGDGYDDILVDAFFYSPDLNRVQYGACLIYLGSAQGIPSGTIADADTMLVPSGPRDAFLFGDAWGSLLDGLGDVNGDGYADFMIGDYHNDPVLGFGQIYIFHGGPGGIPSGSEALAATKITSGRFRVPLEPAPLQSGAGVGDVNGDGYDDLILGDLTRQGPQYDGNGVAFVIHGSASGIPSGDVAAVANVTLEGTDSCYPKCGGGDPTSSIFGASVQGAGDINGDGYSDVAVSSPRYEIGKGAVYLFSGGSGGVSPALNSVIYGDNVNSSLYYGISLGDLNADGYSDIACDAPYFTSAFNSEGGIFVYPGAPSGIASSVLSLAPFKLFGNAINRQLGQGIASLGDFDGDGHFDTAITRGDGTPGLYPGGDNGAIHFAPHPRLADNSAPLQVGARIAAADGFRIVAQGRNPYGRGKVKLEWEVKPRGTNFDGTGLQRAAAWTDSGTAGIELNELVTGLQPGTKYHWRARLLYKASHTPWQTHSRWVSPANDGWELANDLETAPAASRREFGDFDNSGCTDLSDFLFLLDYWQLVSPIGGDPIGLTDFLALLDYWQLGPSC